MCLHNCDCLCPSMQAPGGRSCSSGSSGVSVFHANPGKSRAALRCKSRYTCVRTCQYRPWAECRRFLHRTRESRDCQGRLRQDSRFPTCIFSTGRTVSVWCIKEQIWQSLLIAKGKLGRLRLSLSGLFKLFVYVLANFSESVYVWATHLQIPYPSPRFCRACTNFQ